jgi:hypothetical protein
MFYALHKHRKVSNEEEERKWGGGGGSRELCMLLQWNTVQIFLYPTFLELNAYQKYKMGKSYVLICRRIAFPMCSPQVELTLAPCYIFG